MSSPGCSRRAAIAVRVRRLRPPPRTVTGVIVPDDLPLSRAGVDRAALLADRRRVRRRRADRRRDPRAARVRRRGRHRDGLAGRAAAAVARSGCPRRTTTAGSCSVAVRRARRTSALRVPDRRPAPRVGEASDVLVHAAPTEVGPATAPALPDGLTWTPLRDIGADLTAHEAGLATTAVALDAWHARHPRCPRCGAATRVAQSGWTRVCVDDGSEHYPRTDPAVIMAVVDADDRILLGHAAHWPAGPVVDARRASSRRGSRSSTPCAARWPRRPGCVVGDVVLPGEPAVAVPGVAHDRLPRPRAVHGRDGGRRRADARRAGSPATSSPTAVRSGDVIPPGRASIARALVEEWFGGPLS